MKIFDRYIMASVAGAFLFGIAMFMGLLLAMDLMKKLVELIAEQGVPVLMALKIFAYRIPSMLAYAFPMSVLLAILLVFNRMSSESEMVAIRAAGISFTRIVIPTLLFALLVTGLTFYIADAFAPFAGKRAAILTRAALKEVKGSQSVSFKHVEKGHVLYQVGYKRLDLDSKRMEGVWMLIYEDDAPAYYVYADHALYDMRAGRWHFYSPNRVEYVKAGDANGFTVESSSADGEMTVGAIALKLKEDPFDLDAAKKRPEEFTARELHQRAAHLRENLNQDEKDIGKWRMAFFQRFATPFSCLVFALIGAPLGLRHHRTSSAVGLGISLLVIFGYYFFSVYMNTFGESGAMPAWLAAWLPNMLGAVVGMVLIVKANK